LEVDLLEKVVINEKGIPYVAISYGPTAKIDSEINSQPIKMHAQTTSMFRAMPPSFHLNPDAGLLNRVSKNINPKVPFDLRRDFLQFFSQMCSSLECTMLPIPNRPLDPQVKWNTNIALLRRQSRRRPQQGPTVRGSPKTIDLQLVCTYEGTRMRNGREEAMITVVARSRGGPRERSGPRATSPANSASNVAEVLCRSRRSG